MTKGQTETIVDSPRFELYTDHLGRYWLWNKIEEVNHAIRAKTEREAWIKAVESMAHYMELYKSSRKEATAKLQKIETVVKDVFELRDENDSCNCGWC